LHGEWTDDVRTRENIMTGNKIFDATASHMMPMASAKPPNFFLNVSLGIREKRGVSQSTTYHAWRT